MALAMPGGRSARARGLSAGPAPARRLGAVPPGALGLVCALALAARGTQAETVAFSGKVVDQAGNPLPWALLAVAGTPLAGQSRADGTFSLSGDVPTGLSGGTRSFPVPAPIAARYRADGRILGPGAEGIPAGPWVTSTLPYAREPRAAGPLAAAPAASGTARVAPAAARIAAGWTLSVSMAHFQDGSFPQAASPAKGLVLALAPSAHAHFRIYSKLAVPADAEDAIPGWPLKSYQTVAAVVYAGAKMMWDEGPGGGHYQNIAGDQKEVGCGIYVTPQGGVWILHDFK